MGIGRGRGRQPFVGGGASYLVRTSSSRFSANRTASLPWSGRHSIRYSCKRASAIYTQTPRAASTETETGLFSPPFLHNTGCSCTVLYYSKTMGWNDRLMQLQWTERSTIRRLKWRRCGRGTIRGSEDSVNISVGNARNLLSNMTKSAQQIYHCLNRIFLKCISNIFMCIQILYNLHNYLHRINLRTTFRRIILYNQHFIGT